MLTENIQIEHYILDNSKKNQDYQKEKRMNPTRHMFQYSRPLLK